MADEPRDKDKVERAVAGYPVSDGYVAALRIPNRPSHATIVAHPDLRPAEGQAVLARENTDGRRGGWERGTRALAALPRCRKPRAERLLDRTGTAAHDARV